MLLSLSCASLSCGQLTCAYSPRRRYSILFGAEIVNYADDFVICGRSPTEAMRVAVLRMMERTPVVVFQHAEDPLCTRAGGTVGVPCVLLETQLPAGDGREYLGTRPSAESVRNVCRRTSELTQVRDRWLDEGAMVERLNRVLLGWANYFHLGLAIPGYRKIEKYTTERLRQWLRRKHKVRSEKHVRYPDERLWEDMGLSRA